MRVSPINNNISKRTNFRGVKESAYGENTIKNSSNWHKHSKIVTTLGDFHVYPKNKAYFASPMEYVTDAIKDEVDYVIYDNEPPYPDIDEVGLNYFNKYRRNFGEEFNELREYFYRREMGGHADIQHAKDEQTKAAKCLGLYNEGGHLRYEKEKTEDEIVKILDINAKKAEGIADTRQEIAAQKILQADAEKHIKNLEELKVNYEKVINSMPKSVNSEQDLLSGAENKVAKAHRSQTVSEGIKEYGKYHNTTENFINIEENKAKLYSAVEQKAANKVQYDKIINTIGFYKAVKDGAVKLIANMEAYVKKLTTEIAKSEQDVKNKEAYIKECKAKLIPIFDSLKHFYTEQGIKGIKKL